MFILAANATALRVMQLAPNEVTQLQSLDLAAPSATVGLTISKHSFCIVVVAILIRHCRPQQPPGIESVHEIGTRQ